MSNDLSNKQLQELVEKLSWNDSFGCYTRAGFDKMVWPMIREQARWIIYFDVDGMHDLNESFGGYEQVDAMIRKVLDGVRSSDFVAGQWKSGDEFLVCLTENDDHNPLDPYAMMDRMIEDLGKQGLTATFGIVPVTSDPLPVILKPAVDHVYQMKKQRTKKGSRR